MWSRVVAAKRAYDPGMVLAPGYELFAFPPEGDIRSTTGRLRAVPTAFGGRRFADG